MKLYGLKNCDTCRKARKALDAKGVAYSFFDVREDGVKRAEVSRWAKSASWEKLLNKSSTTWRGLADAEKDKLTEAKAVALMVAYPTLIKRPVVECGAEIFVGWSADIQKKLVK